MKIIITVITVIAVITVIGVAISFSGGENTLKSVSMNGRVDANFDQAPAFTLNNYIGGTVSLSDSAGKIRVINSWATWCPFCVDELPDFAKLQTEFADDIVMIAIDRQEPLAKAKGFTDDLGITDGIVFLLDPRDSFYASIGGFSMPETLFIDGEDNIRSHKRGPMSLEEMRAKVLDIL